MAKRKAMEDPPLYTGFTMGCVYVTKGKHIRPINASVRCKDDKNGWPNKCPTCGWNPACKEKRLTAMVGEKMARKLIAQSEELSIKTKEEINRGAYPYVL